LARSKGGVFYDICQQCGREKGHSKRERCVWCAAKWRSKNYPNAMLGKKLTATHKIALSAANQRQSKKTNPEKKVEKILNSIFGLKCPFVYTGCGENAFWITISPHRVRRPDFTDRNGLRIIEVFGRYWHPTSDEVKAIDEYRSVGWKCLVVWEDEIEQSINRIAHFCRATEGV
jgi:hypothetical protein